MSSGDLSVLVNCQQKRLRAGTYRVLKKQLWAGQQTFIMWGLFTVTAKRKTTISDFYFRVSYELFLKILYDCTIIPVYLQTDNSNTWLQSSSLSNQDIQTHLSRHHLTGQQSRNSTHNGTSRGSCCEATAMPTVVNKEASPS